MLRELTYTVELREKKKGCIGYTTSNCKRFASDIVQSHMIDYKLDSTKFTESKGAYKWQNSNVVLITNYKID